MIFRKRLKGDADMEVKDRDRISNLPDVLLDNILSSLPTKDAVATSVLSWRWRWAFTWVTCLDFDDSPISHCVEYSHLIDSFPSFKAFVDNILQACQSERTTTFRLHFAKNNISRCLSHYCSEECLPEMELEHLYAWMKFPLTRGVTQIDICARVQNPGKLPSALYSCRTLEVLKLNVTFDLEVPLSMCLPNLKELHLTKYDFPVDDSVSRLVSSCPSLELLALKGHLTPSSPFSISSPSLRRLTINFLVWDGRPRSKLVLDVPNLEYLMYQDVLAMQYSIGDLNSLVEAEVDTMLFYTSERQIDNILSFLSPLSNVRRLFLMRGCVEVCPLVLLSVCAS